MKKIILLLINILFFLPFSFGQLILDGNITEPEWGTALATSAGSPSSTFNGVNEVNAIYVTNENDGNFLLGIAGNIEFGNRILVFLDSKTGGYTDGSFDRTDAPFGVDNFNSGTTFDVGFQPDYCLVIGLDNPFTAYFFDMFKLSTTGEKNYLGNSQDANFGANPTGGDNTRGFEARIPLSTVEYDGSGMKAMVMYISDAGFLSNQFLTPAGSGQGDYGSGAINFSSEPPNFITVSAIVLDVELSNFSAKKIDNNVVLNWSTSSEINNARFEIEKSANGKEFEVIGRVEGKGNSSEVIDYRFVDKNPFSGINYYRLKQMDFDGSSTYSDVVSIIFNENIEAKIYPNPLINQLKLTIDKQLFGTIRITNINGQIVYTQQQIIDNTTEIDLSNLLNGMYYVEIISEKERIFYTIVTKL